MAASTSRPCVIQYGQVRSGDLNTGQLMTSPGGQRAGVVWSGSLLTVAAFGGVPGASVSGGHILVTSGAGRLDSVFIHQNTLTMSGVAVNFYDAGAITVSGVSVSGQRILAAVNAPGGVSGQLSYGGVPQFYGTPFYSGLCVSAPSGSPGFTFTYTMEG